MSLDELHGVVAEQRRGIAGLADRLVVAIPIEHAVLLMSEIVDFPDQRPILGLEPR